MTAVIVKKRERTQNWAAEEKSALFCLVKTYVEAIENKKIDAAASAMKILAWQQIHSTFHGLFSTERNIARMREQWRRMKAQARIEIYSFAEKVRTLGPEKASKNRPSNLSIEIWHLMESSRRRGTNSETEISDESREDAHAGVENLQTILNNLALPSTPEISVDEVKIENCSNNENNEEKSYRNMGEEQLLLSEKKTSCEQQTNVIDNQKRAKMDEIFLRYFQPGEIGDVSDNVSHYGSKDQSGALRNTIWIFEAAQKQHTLKLKMLDIELERAELLKQSALNELKTSELKIELIESQIAEFYR